MDTAVFSDRCALRMRVSMSAIGSLILIIRSRYQLALITPGTSPRMANSRSLPRPRPNFLNTPRGRPVKAQRLRKRTGLASRGNCCNLSRAPCRSSALSVALWIAAMSSARLAAYFFTVSRRFCSRLTKDFFAIPASALKREFKRSEQGAALLVGFGSGCNGDIHPAQRIDLVILDFRENDLLLDAQVVIAAAIKGTGRNAAEVTDARHCDSHQPLQEFEHALAAQRHFAADRIVLADLESSDRLARLGHHRLLPGDFLHVADRIVNHLLVRHRLAHTHVERDLHDARHFHHGFVAKLLGQLPDHRIPVIALEISHIRPLRLDHFAVGFEVAHFAPVLQHLEADAVGLLRRSVEQGHVGNVDLHLLLDNATGLAFHGVGLLVLLNPVGAFHHHLAGIQHPQHSTALALVLARNDNYVIALANLAHNASLQHFRGQRHDLHEALAAQFARHRAKDTGAYGFQLVVQQHRGIAVKFDERAIRAAHPFGSAHHDCIVDLALLDTPAWCGVLDADLDYVADAGVTTLGAAQHLDAHYRACAGVVCNVQQGLHLYH